MRSSSSRFAFHSAPEAGREEGSGAAGAQCAVLVKGTGPRCGGGSCAAPRELALLSPKSKVYHVLISDTHD